MGNPGAVVRVAPGSHPPETALTEVYNVPPPASARGADIDGNGVVWVSMASTKSSGLKAARCGSSQNSIEIECAMEHADDIDIRR